jgi:hypothetical protein
LCLAAQHGSKTHKSVEAYLHVFVSALEGHAQTASLLGQRPTVPTEQEAEWVPDSIFNAVLRGGGGTMPLPGIKPPIPRRPASILVTTATETQRLHDTVTVSLYVIPPAMGPNCHAVYDVQSETEVNSKASIMFPMRYELRLKKPSSTEHTTQRSKIFVFG